MKTGRFKKLDVIACVPASTKLFAHDQPNIGMKGFGDHQRIDYPSPSSRRLSIGA